MPITHPLKAYRQKHGLSSRAAGQKFGCAGSTIDRIEQDNRPPSPIVMQRMIDVTGGALLPNDFYKLPENSPSPASAA